MLSSRHVRATSLSEADSLRMVQFIDDDAAAAPIYRNQTLITCLNHACVPAPLGEDTRERDYEHKEFIRETDSGKDIMDVKHLPQSKTVRRFLSRIKEKCNTLGFRNESLVASKAGEIRSKFNVDVTVDSSDVALLFVAAFEAGEFIAQKSS